MLVEPFAHHRVEDNITPVGRMYYSASTTLCCAQAGEPRLTGVFDKAGFRHFR